MNHNTMSWHGQMHFVAGAVGFTGLIVGSFVLANRFRSLDQMGWSVYSLVTGVIFLSGFLGVASGAKGTAIIFFSLAVAQSFAWLSAVFHHLRSGTNSGQA